MKNKNTLVVLLIVLVAAVGYLFLTRKPAEQTQTTFPEVVLSGETEGWKVYRNERLGFAFAYPSDWAYEDIDLSDADVPEDFFVGLGPSHGDFHDWPISVVFYSGSYAATKQKLLETPPGGGIETDITEKQIAVAGRKWMKLSQFQVLDYELEIDGSRTNKVLFYCRYFTSIEEVTYGVWCGEKAVGESPDADISLKIIETFRIAE